MKKKIYIGLIILIIALVFGGLIYTQYQEDEQAVKTGERVQQYSKEAYKNGMKEMPTGIGAKPIVIKKSDLEKDNIGQDDE
jgi:hypothetical protein